MWQGMTAPIPVACSLKLVTPPCPTKIYTDYFLLNHPFNVKCIPIKIQPYSTPIVFATLCGKGQLCYYTVIVPRILMNMTFANIVPIQSIMNFDEQDFSHII
jgi:hypothetical protein